MRCDVVEIDAGIFECFFRNALMPLSDEDEESDMTYLGWIFCNQSPVYYEREKGNKR